MGRGKRIFLLLLISAFRNSISFSENARKNLKFSLCMAEPVAESLFKGSPY
jgi:hypothetical protein